MEKSKKALKREALAGGAAALAAFGTGAVAHNNVHADSTQPKTQTVQKGQPAIQTLGEQKAQTNAGGQQAGHQNDNSNDNGGPAANNQSQSSQPTSQQHSDNASQSTPSADKAAETNPAPRTVPQQTAPKTNSTLNHQFSAPQAQQNNDFSEPTNNTRRSQSSQQPSNNLSHPQASISNSSSANTFSAPNGFHPAGHTRQELQAAHLKRLDAFHPVFLINQRAKQTPVNLDLSKRHAADDIENAGLKAFSHNVDEDNLDKIITSAQHKIKQVKAPAHVKSVKQRATDRIAALERQQDIKEALGTASPEMTLVAAAPQTPADMVSQLKSQQYKQGVTPYTDAPSNVPAASLNVSGSTLNIGSGVLPTGKLNDSGKYNNVTTVNMNGTTLPQFAQGALSGMPNLTTVQSNNVDASHTANMSNILGGDPKLTNISGLANWKVNGGAALDNMFNGDSALSDISGLSNWKPQYNNMSNMFHGTNVSNLHPLTNWDVSDVNDLDNMFSNDKALSDVSPIGNWQPKNANNISGMFQNDSKLSNWAPLQDWTFNGQPTDTGMLAGTAANKGTSPAVNKTASGYKLQSGPQKANNPQPKQQNTQPANTQNKGTNQKPTAANDTSDVIPSNNKNTNDNNGQDANKYIVPADNQNDTDSNSASDPASNSGDSSNSNSLSDYIVSPTDSTPDENSASAPTADNTNDDDTESAGSNNKSAESSANPKMDSDEVYYTTPDNQIVGSGMVSAPDGSILNMAANSPYNTQHMPKGYHYDDDTDPEAYKMTDSMSPIDVQVAKGAASASNSGDASVAPAGSDASWERGAVTPSQLAHPDTEGITGASEDGQAVTPSPQVSGHYSKQSDGNTNTGSANNSANSDNSSNNGSNSSNNVSSNDSTNSNTDADNGSNSNSDNLPQTGDKATMVAFIAGFGALFTLAGADIYHKHHLQLLAFGK